MRLPLAALLLLPLAGCAGPEADASGPIALDANELGLVLLDTQERTKLVLSPTSRLGWMSPGGSILVWEGEEDYYVLSNRTLRSVQPSPITIWSRIEDDVTGIVMERERVVRRLLTNGSEIAGLPLPHGPRPDGTWSGASTDLGVLAAEFPGATGGPGCTHVLVMRDNVPENATDTVRQGCHLRVARDGRVGWTENTGVAIRERNGTLRDLTGTGRDVNGTFVAHENPVFTAEGIVLLRLSGGETLQRTEIVDDVGEVLARLEGDTRLALLDVSTDGRFVLFRAFERPR